MKRQVFSYLAIVTLSAILMSCDPKDDFDYDNLQTSTFKTITVKVTDNEEYNYYDFDSNIDEVRALVDVKNEISDKIGSFSVGEEVATGRYANKSVTINFPDNIDDQFLGYTFDDYDLNVSAGYGLSLVVLQAYRSGIPVGCFHYSNEKNVSGSLYYCNNDVDITGSTKGGSNTKKYAVSLKKGWNIIYETYGSTETYTTRDPGNMKWYFEPYRNYDNRYLPKLLEKKHDYTYSVKAYYEYHYDPQNRLQQVKYSIPPDGNLGNYYETTTFTYNDNDLETVEIKSNSGLDAKYEYKRNGSQIAVKGYNRGVFDQEELIELNNDELPVRWEYRSLDSDVTTIFIPIIESGNLVKLTYQKIVTSTGEKKENDYSNQFKYIDDKYAPFNNCRTPRWYLIYRYRELGGRNADLSKGYSTYDRDGYPTHRYISGSVKLEHEYNY